MLYWFISGLFLIFIVAIFPFASSPLPESVHLQDLKPDAHILKSPIQHHPKKVPHLDPF